LSLSVGRTLSHYRIVERIGEGGMGVVWRATDTTLGRDVAIKVLPEEFASDPERMARFEREAKILAALNHPRIASIYGLASADGVRFLAMELVEGDDLAARLAHGPLPVVEALELARQVAEALEAAHEKGIIHRDLKPANIKLTSDGQVKVLDFGLAKALEDERTASGSASKTQSPTVTERMTAANVILGTAAYMSPEQARGKSVDRRADIWAFGCVLYEALTGRRAFEGETVSDTLARILEREPDLTALPSGVPPRVRELLVRCLTKDPRLRLRDIGDARIQLDEVLAARSPSGRLIAVEGSTGGTTRTRSPLLGIAAAGVLGLVAGALLWNALGPHRGGGDGEPRCLTVDMPADVAVQFAGLTRDGRTLVMRGQPRGATGADARAPVRLYARPLTGYEFRALPGTEEALGFSTDLDSRGILFVAPVSPGATQRRLAHVPLDGSAPPTTITDWKDSWRSLCLMNNGDILILEGSTSFVRLPAAGGPPSAPVKIDTGRPGVSRCELQESLPGDHGVLVDIISYDARGWHYSIGVVDPKSGKTEVIVEDGGAPVLSPTGHLLFCRGDAMLAVGFDSRSGRTRGTPVAVWSGISTPFAFQPGFFAVGRDGSLFYLPGRAGGERRLAFLDAAGKTESWSTEERAVDGTPEPSPDGRRFACSIANARGIDEIWVSEIARPGFRRLGTDPNADCYWPVWSPDGKWISYRRRGGDSKDGLYIQSAEGGEARRILAVGSTDEQHTAVSWLPDGSAMLGWKFDRGKSELWKLPFSGTLPDTSGLRTLLPSAFNQFNPRVNRDGRLLAYGGDESGRAMTYVAELRADGGAGTPIEVRTEGSNGHLWSADGRTLFVLDDRQRLMKVAVTREPELAVSAPTEVFDFEKLGITYWSLLPDGRFFVGLKNANEADVTRYNLVLDWTEALKRKMSAAR
jgi:serine/threonine-protein kinase